MELCREMWRDSGLPTDSFYEVRPECNDVPKTKFKIKNGRTLSQRRWQAAFSPEGYLDIAPTLSRIHRGGVHPSIRGEVWEFLLGCFDPKSTFDERDQIRQRRRVQYARWKEECREMDSHVGSGRVITAPIITEDGVPIKDPLVLLEAGPKEVASGNGYTESNDQVVTDKKIIQWKLTLHQIGKALMYFELTGL